MNLDYVAGKRRIGGEGYGILGLATSTHQRGENDEQTSAGGEIGDLPETGRRCPRHVVCESGKAPDCGCDYEGARRTTTDKQVPR